MIKTERQNKILEIVTDKKFCTVSYLAKALYVSPITVRRDLNVLESAGLVKRCYGGVSLYQHLNREVPLEVRENSNTSVKATLGKRAAELIKTGDTVFIDASSTVLHVIDFMTQDMNLTVITNSVTALDRLKERHIRCYSTGGMLLENSNALVGSIAEKCISGMYADIMFFSTQGITDTGDITDYSESETQLRRIMLEHSKKSVYIFDSSKLGKRYLFGLCSYENIDHIITDANIDFEK